MQDLVQVKSSIGMKHQWSVKSDWWLLATFSLSSAPPAVPQKKVHPVTATAAQERVIVHWWLVLFADSAVGLQHSLSTLKKY